MEGGLWRRRPGGLLDGRGAPARRGSAAHEERGVRRHRRRRRLEVDVLDGEDLGRDALGLVGLARYAFLISILASRERARQGRDDFGSEPKYPSCRSPSVPGRRLDALENSSAKIM